MECRIVERRLWEFFKGIWRWLSIWLKTGTYRIVERGLYVRNICKYIDFWTRSASTNEICIFFIFVRNKNQEKNYLLDLRGENNNKKKNYVTLKEDEDHQTFKRKSPDTYLEVSIKHHDEYKHKNPNMFYVQIVEPIQSITPSQDTQDSTWRQRWENSKVKELLR